MRTAAVENTHSPSHYNTNQQSLSLKLLSPISAPVLDQTLSLPLFMRRKKKRNTKSAVEEGGTHTSCTTGKCLGKHGISQHTLILLTRSNRVFVCRARCVLAAGPALAGMYLAASTRKVPKYDLGGIAAHRPGSRTRPTGGASPSLHRLTKPCQSSASRGWAEEPIALLEGKGCVHQGEHACYETGVLLLHSQQFLCSLTSWQL